MRYISLISLAAFGRLAAAVSPEESKCRFRGVRLQMYDDADVNLYNMLITFREQDKTTGKPAGRPECRQAYEPPELAALPRSERPG